MNDHNLGLWDLVYQSARFQEVFDESYSATPVEYIKRDTIILRCLQFAHDIDRIVERVLMRKQHF